MRHLFFAAGFALLFACTSLGQGTSGTGGTSGGGTPTSAALGSTVDMPEFQGFETQQQTFVGIPDNASFVGVDDVSSGNNNVTSSRRNTSTRRTTTTRRTTSSRMSASRTSMGRSTANSRNSTSVRATTTADFGFSPLGVAGRENAFRTRLPRLNLSVVPEQLNVQVNSKPEGTVATLNGTVATQRDRKLIQQLLLLEPGIDKVDNQLVIRSDSNTKSVPTLE